MLSASLKRQLAYCCSLHFHLLLNPCAVAVGDAAVRSASSSAQSSRWQSRQGRDSFSREAKVQGLKSRAAFKLLQISEKYKIFRKGNTVVDLGYAPGSWSQVAVTRTAPRGRVIGVDILPAQPPRGVSTIQGDFLSQEIQAAVRAYVLDPERGRPKRQSFFRTFEEAQDEQGVEDDDLTNGQELCESRVVDQLEHDDARRNADHAVETDTAEQPKTAEKKSEERKSSQREKDEADGRVVDVVLSDMSEPWDQTIGFGKRSISNPYSRMMNTSGNSFRDHAGSMDLCTAAFTFGFDTLRSGGHLVCKFYQGAEDKVLEKKLKRLFEKVHRDKPAASRSESREGYFVALRRKSGPTKEEVFAE